MKTSNQNSDNAVRGLIVSALTRGHRAGNIREVRAELETGIQSDPDTASRARAWQILNGAIAELRRQFPDCQLT